MPIYRVWYQARGQTFETGNDIWAVDAANAATNWALWHDPSGAQRLCESGSKMILHVCIVSNCFHNVSDGETIVMEVSGEDVPTYRARIAPSKD